MKTVGRETHAAGPARVEFRGAARPGIRHPSRLGPAKRGGHRAGSAAAWRRRTYSRAEVTGNRVNSLTLYIARLETIVQKQRSDGLLYDHDGHMIFLLCTIIKN